MYTLMVIATSTALGTFSSLPACRSAIRQVYTQKMDPYHTIPPETIKQVIDIKMRYSAPRDYVCLKMDGAATPKAKR